MACKQLSIKENPIRHAKYQLSGYVFEGNRARLAMAVLILVLLHLCGFRCQPLFSSIQRPRFIKLRILREAKRWSFWVLIVQHIPPPLSLPSSREKVRLRDIGKTWRRGTLLARVPIPSFLGMGKKWTRKKTSSDNVLHRVVHPHPDFPQATTNNSRRALVLLDLRNVFFFTFFADLILPPRPAHIAWHNPMSEKKMQELNCRCCSNVVWQSKTCLVVRTHLLNSGRRKKFASLLLVYAEQGESRVIMECPQGGEERGEYVQNTFLPLPPLGP